MGELTSVRKIYQTIIFVLLVVILLAVPIGLSYYNDGSEKTRREAIEAGVAEYYLDQNYDKQFRYIPKEEIKGNVTDIEGLYLNKGE